MTAKQRFLIGALGSSLPILVSFLAVDIGALIDRSPELTLGNYLGTAIRYMILAAVGGTIAALNQEDVPLKLAQLGMAAPALIASYVNSQDPAMPPQASGSVAIEWDLSIISSANAQEISSYAQKAPKEIVLAGLLADVVQGVTKPVKSIQTPPPLAQVQPRPSVSDIERAQRYLVALGYRTGGVNGSLDDTTVAQVNAFQRDRGLPVRATIDASVLESLRTTLVSVLSEEEE